MQHVLLHVVYRASRCMLCFWTALLGHFMCVGGFAEGSAVNKVPPPSPHIASEPPPHFHRPASENARRAHTRVRAHTPEVHGCQDDHRLVVVSTVDNLLKGAATQVPSMPPIAIRPTPSPRAHVRNEPALVGSPCISSMRVGFWMLAGFAGIAEHQHRAGPARV